MEISNTGLQFIMDFEPFKVQASYDILRRRDTIAYGSIEYDKNKPVTSYIHKPDISFTDGKQILLNNLQHLVYTAIAKLSYTPNQNQFDALCDFLYSNFSRKIISDQALNFALKNNDPSFLLNWVTGVIDNAEVVLPQIQERRQKEITLWNTGTYMPSLTIKALSVNFENGNFVQQQSDTFENDLIKLAKQELSNGKSISDVDNKGKLTTCSKRIDEYRRFS